MKKLDLKNFHHTNTQTHTLHRESCEVMEVLTLLRLSIMSQYIANHVIYGKLTQCYNSVISIKLEKLRNNT